MEAPLRAPPRLRVVVADDHHHVLPEIHFVRLFILMRICIRCSSV
jgi:hypothetical protein